MRRTHPIRHSSVVASRGPPVATDDGEKARQGQHRKSRESSLRFHTVEWEHHQFGANDTRSGVSDQTAECRTGSDVGVSIAQP